MVALFSGTRQFRFALSVPFALVLWCARSHWSVSCALPGSIARCVLVPVSLLSASLCASHLCSSVFLTRDFPPEFDVFLVLLQFDLEQCVAQGVLLGDGQTLTEDDHVQVQGGGRRHLRQERREEGGWGNSKGES